MSESRYGSRIRITAYLAGIGNRAVLFTGSRYGSRGNAVIKHGNGLRIRIAAHTAGIGNRAFACTGSLYGSRGNAVINSRCGFRIRVAARLTGIRYGAAACTGSFNSRRRIAVICSRNCSLCSDSYITNAANNAVTGAGRGTSRCSTGNYNLCVSRKSDGNQISGYLCIAYGTVNYSFISSLSGTGGLNSIL